MAYLVGNWWRLLPPTSTAVGLALVAIVCGAIVGAERERREKPAGLRTLVLVCLGSAVFTMASFAFTTTTGDSGRVSAQIVTGIGFLGGGVILRDASGVKGATTAAAIWVTAAMGMVIGLGLPGGGLGLAVLIRLALVVLQKGEERWFAELRATAVALTFDPDHGKTRLRIEGLLVAFDPHYRELPADPGPSDGAHARFVFRLGHGHTRELLAELADLRGIHDIREEPVPEGRR